MPWNYALVKDNLTEAEKTRMICLYLNADHKTINWDQATKDLGGTSVGSLKTMARQALKKLEDAAAAGGDGGTPAKATPAKRGRKAKAQDGEDGAGEDDEDEEKPKKKAKGRGKKVKAKGGNAEQEEGDEEGEGVKLEENDDE